MAESFKFIAIPLAGGAGLAALANLITSMHEKGITGPNFDALCKELESRLSSSYGCPSAPSGGEGGILHANDNGSSFDFSLENLAHIDPLYLTLGAAVLGILGIRIFARA